MVIINGSKFEKDPEAVRRVLQVLYAHNILNLSICSHTGKKVISNSAMSGVVVQYWYDIDFGILI